MFSSIAHKTKFWSFTRKRFCVVCALNCARILVIRALNCAQFILHPALFPTWLEHCHPGPLVVNLVVISSAWSCRQSGLPVVNPVFWSSTWSCDPLVVRSSIWSSIWSTGPQSGHLVLNTVLNPVLWSADPPDRPADLHVTSVDKDRVSLEWTPPVDTGGMSLTQYVVERRDVTRGTGVWVVALTLEPTVMQCTVKKLFQGNAYEFRVFAENKVGIGKPVELGKAVVAKLPYGECVASLSVISVKWCQY